MKNHKFPILMIVAIAVLSVVLAVVLLKPELYTYHEKGETNVVSQETSNKSDSNPENSSSSEDDWGSGSIYNGSAPIIRKMGEQLKVVGIPHRKQGEKPPMSTEVFAFWEGEMIFTVNSAVIYNTIEETGLNSNDFVADFSVYDETFRPMVVELTIENVNAESVANPSEFFSDHYVLSSKEEFSPEKFRAHADNEWRVASGMPLAYADPHSNGMYDYFHYTIDQSETIQMTLCYYVKTDDVPLDELYLEIRTQSSDHRFGIKLDQLKEAE